MKTDYRTWEFKMKTKSKIVIAALGLAFVTAAYASYSCPIDNSGMYWTGQTRAEMGKLLYEYKCPSGHVSWIVQ